jgi:predicted small integral membrane protein
MRSPVHANIRVVRPGWQALGTLPFVSLVLVAFNGLYMLLAAFGNITDYPANQAFVQHVLAMDTTNFGASPGTGLDPDVMWRAITNPVTQNVCYLGVIFWETATGIVLATAVVQRVRERGTARTTATTVATAGLLMILLLFFGGFVVIGGEWFQMWRSTAWNGLDPAFRNSALALLTLVLLHLPAHPRHGAAITRQIGVLGPAANRSARVLGTRERGDVKR